MISVKGVAWAAVVAAALALLAAGAVQAAITIDMVTVGNPGNTADTHGAGYGAVADPYKIGKYEVTAGQYTAFLTAVATTDTYGLYNTGMSSTSLGSGITQGGLSGSYAYSVASNYANRPVNYVSWGDAARFANWLTNGQPTGAQVLTTTENGSYYLDGAKNSTALMGVTRIKEEDRVAGKKYYFIPTENEWYKAAYYDPNKGGIGVPGYWDYPTSNNTAPGRDMADPLPGNNANIYGTPYPIDSGKYTTVAGEFQNSDSPYGTFDQGGNVWEWNEAIIGSDRGLRGGSGFSNPSGGLRAEDRGYDYYPTFEYFHIGFRVSEVPEPATMSLLALGGLVALRRRR